MASGPEHLGKTTSLECICYPFVGVCFLVLLNLLIAVMTSSYGEVLKDSKARWCCLQLRDLRKEEQSVTMRHYISHQLGVAGPRKLRSVAQKIMKSRKQNGDKKSSAGSLFSLVQRMRQPSKRQKPNVTIQIP